VSTTIQTISADQLFQMPHHGSRFELVKGVLRKTMPRGFHHGQLVVNLTVSLGTYVKANSPGVVVGTETGFKIESNPDTVLAPDVAFVRQERVLQMGRTEKFWPGAPDLAVEVLSPSDTVYEVDEKVAAWQRPHR
jgi:Uma2 family endonuclease